MGIRFELSGIPVDARDPLVGSRIQDLLVSFGYADAISTPNGLLFLVLGRYIPSYVMDGFIGPDWEPMVRIHDFRVEAEGLAGVSYINSAGEVLTMTISLDMAFLETNRTWDLLFIAFNMLEPTEPDPSLGDYIESIRAAHIISPAFVLQV